MLTFTGRGAILHGRAKKRGRRAEKEFQKNRKISKKVLDMAGSLWYSIKAAAPKDRRSEYLEN